MNNKLSHPYKNFPDSSFWRRSMTSGPASEIDPVTEVPFTFGPKSKVATAGSCFAQHITRYLRKNGFQDYVTEAAHPLMNKGIASKFNYGTFTARYGNVYTARNLLQLHQRAYGHLKPEEDVWKVGERQYLDPFRPQIQPGGFISVAELHSDQEIHFAAVRRAFEELDVFIFTLGLTECWYSTRDGAVFPTCPGVCGGTFDPSRHRFKNFGVGETIADMSSFITLLRERNPSARVILTVSPVPLIATAEPQHVLVSSTYSKSVLRVAAEELTKQFRDVAYFPSYEIITGGLSRGAYFGPDLRLVTEAGVSHVMRIFLQHFVEGSFSDGAHEIFGEEESTTYLKEMELAAKVNCDLEALDPKS